MQERFEEAARLQPALPLPPPFDPMTLPERSQAALIFLTVSPVKMALVQRLLVDSKDHLIGEDYRPLREHGLAEYKTGKRLHDLTPKGIAVAKDLQHILCQQFDIHLLLESPANLGWQTQFECPCGWTTLVRRSTTAPSNARSRFNQYHATFQGMSKLVAALKPPVFAAEG